MAIAEDIHKYFGATRPDERTVEPPEPRLERPEMDDMGGDLEGRIHEYFTPPDRPLESGYSYWEDPRNVAMHWQAQLSAPPGVDIGEQYGWDTDAVAEANEYFRTVNNNDPWWMWKPLDPSDPYREQLMGMGEPPPESQYKPGKVYQWQVPTPEQAVEQQQPTAEGEWPRMGTPEYEALPGWQKIMMGVTSSGALSGVETMLPWAGLSLLMGGPTAILGLPAMLAGGAGLGHFTSEETFTKLTQMGGWRAALAETLQPLAQKTFMLLNWPTERLEQAVGLAAQLNQFGFQSTALHAAANLAPALNKAFGLTINDVQLANAATMQDERLRGVLDELENAWQAGRLAYEATGAGPVGSVIGNLPAAFLGHNTRMPGAIEWMWDKLTTGETDVVFAKPGEVWVLGQREPVKLDKTSIGILNAARAEIAQGADWREVYAKYYDQLGMTGQLTDLFAQSLADPLNLAGGVEAKGLQLFGKAVKNPVLVKAAQIAQKSGEGMIGTRRIYRAILPGEVSVAKMTPGQLKMAGMNEQGQYVNLTPNRSVSTVGRRVGEAAVTLSESPMNPGNWVGFAKNLFELTPDSRYKAMMEMTHDTAGLLLNMAEGDPREMYRLAQAWRDLDVREAAAVAEILGMADAATIKQGLGGVDVDALRQTWEMGANARRVLDNIAEALGERPQKILDRMREAKQGNAKWAESMATRIREQATQRGKAGMLGEEFNGRALGEALAYLDDNWWAADEGAARAVLHNAIIDGVSDWGLAAYGVKPDSPALRITSGLKSAQSLLLLGLNPAYKVNNDISNAVGTLAEGIFGMASDTTIRAFFDEFGMSPYRLRAGVGAADIEVRPEATGRGLTEAERLREAYAQGGIEATERVGVESVEVKLREARRAKGAIQAGQDIAQKVGSYGPTTRWAASAERKASARASYYGIKQAFSRVWSRDQMIPGMPADLRARIDEIDPRLHDTLLSIVEGSLNPRQMAAKVVQALGGEVVRRSVENYVDDTARAMGVNGADLREMLNTTGIGDEVNSRLAKGMSVTEAFSGAMEKVRPWLDQKLQADLITKAHDSQARVSSEGFVATLDLMKDLQFKLEEMWTRHFAMWEQTYELAANKTGAEYNAMIRARANEARAQWKAYRQWERATWSGVLRELGFGEGQAASHEARLFMKLQKGLHESWGRFFEETSARYEAYYDRMQAEKWSKQKRGTEWRKLQQELSDLYGDYAVRENRYNNLLGYAFVKMFGEQYGPAKSTGAVEYWQAVRQLSTERQEMMKAFRAWERGDMAQVRPDVMELMGDLDPRINRHSAWPRFLSKMYLPLIGQLIKGGLDSSYKMMEMDTLAPEVDPVARYQQTLEELRRTGYEPGREEAPARPMTVREYHASLGLPPVSETPTTRPAARAESLVKVDAPKVDAEAETSLREARNTGLMGPRDRLADDSLPGWFTTELSDRMAGWAQDLYTMLPFGDNVIEIVKTQTNEDIGGEWEGSYRGSNNPLWYREWNDARKAAGLPELDKNSVGNALQRVIQDAGKDLVRFGEETIVGIKERIIEHAIKNGDEFFALYREGYIPAEIRRGNLDEAAAIYDAWITSEEIGARLTRDDLMLIAGGEENLRLVEDHWARDEWRDRLEQSLSQYMADPLGGDLEQILQQFERATSREERDADQAVQDAIEEIGDQATGDGWLREMDERIMEEAEQPEPRAVRLVEDDGAPVKLEEAELDALREDGRDVEELPPAFESWGEFEGGANMSRRMSAEDFARMEDAGTLGEYLRGEAPLMEERRKNVELRAVVEELQQRLRDATIDPDTGAPVWKHVKDEVEAAPAKLMVDVSGLKYVNDNFGFSSGNALLRAFADTARDQGYAVYRVGGDEFILTFESREAAESAAARLQEEFAAVYVPVKPFEGETQYFRGFSIYTGIGETFDAAYHQVDQAKAAYKAVNPELVRGGRPPTVAEAARRYNLADPVERRQALVDLFRFTEEQADGEMVILQRAAEVWATRTGNPVEMFWHGTEARKGMQGAEMPAGAAEVQAAVGGYPRGAFEMIDSTSRMIWALDKADMDTWLHESAHMFYTLGDVETRRMIDEQFGGNTDSFADGYTRWRATGDAPSGTIRAAFEQFRGYVRDMLRRVAQVMKLPESWLPGRELTPEMQRVYQRLFELEPHEMGGREYALGDVTTEAQRAQRLEEHPRLVAEAMDKGLPVKEEVIGEYAETRAKAAGEVESGKAVDVERLAAAGDLVRPLSEEEVRGLEGLNELVGRGEGTDEVLRLMQLTRDNVDAFMLAAQFGTQPGKKRLMVQVGASQFDFEQQYRGKITAAPGEIVRSIWEKMYGEAKKSSLLRESTYGFSKRPWEMTSREWENARESIRPEVRQSDFTRGSGSEAVRRTQQLEYLNYGAHDVASEIIRSNVQARNEGRQLPYTQDEVAAAYDILQRSVTHREVVEKALADGREVPAEVLAEYPDLAGEGGRPSIATQGAEGLENRQTLFQMAARATTGEPNRGTWDPNSPNILWQWEGGEGGASTGAQREGGAVGAQGAGEGQMLPRPDAEAEAASVRAGNGGPSVMPLPRSLNVEMGGRTWRVVGFAFQDGKFAAYVPERFSNLRAFGVGAGGGASISTQREGGTGRGRLLGFNERGEWVYTLEDGQLHTRPMEMTEQPLAAGPLALGTLESVGAAPTYHSEIQGEAYANWVLPALDDMQQRMQADPDMQVRGIDPATMKQVRGWLSQVEQRMPVAKRTATKLGMAKRDAALYNYSRRRNIDNYLGMIYPYQFWMTRNAAAWATRQMDRPAWASQMARMAQFMRSNEDKDDRPSRMKGKFFIPMAWLPEWAGGGVWINPMDKLFPHSQLLRPLDYFMKSQNRIDTLATQQLRDWAKAGEITAEEADEAAKSKSGTVWERARSMAQQAEGSDWMDYMSLFTSPATYLTLPYQLATGKGKETYPMPMSRFIQGLSAATGAEWLKGLDVEANLRDKLGYSKYGQYGDYYVERQLANMAIEGTITAEEASRAMIERSGEAYDEALARVEQEQMMGNPGLSSVYAMRQTVQGKAGIGDVIGSLMTTALGGSILPKGELIYRGLYEEYSAAWAKYRETGDDSAIDQFYEDHPEYEARRALYRKPEERVKYYLVNQVWDSYMALPKLHRRQAAEQLGEQFSETFLDAKDYEGLEADTLAGWARLLGGEGLEGMGEGAEARPLELAEQGVTDAYQAYTEQKAQQFPGLDRVLNAYYGADKAAQDAMRKMNPMIDQYFNWRYQYMADHPETIEYLVGEDSSLAGLKPEVARWMAQYYADRGSMFGDIFTVQNAYYDLPSGKRKAYLAEHPELEQYWTWRRSFQAQHPEIIPFVNSTEKVAEGVLGEDYGDKYATGVDLSALPKDIQADLFGYTMYGARMTQGSYSYLRYQWQRAGRPMGSFNNWLNALTGK